MEPIEEAVRKARMRAKYQGEDPKIYKRAGKEIGASIDAKNADSEKDKKKNYNREISEITKYHANRAKKQTKYFI